ncbi:hypothetical protein VIAG107301_14710 [Vibrio agarivorans]
MREMSRYITYLFITSTLLWSAVIVSVLTRYA